MGEKGGRTETSGQNQGSTSFDQRAGGQRGKNETGRDCREAQKGQVGCAEEEKEVMNQGDVKSAILRL